jgi:hypothetical protein
MKHQLPLRLPIYGLQYEWRAIMLKWSQKFRPFFWSHTKKEQKRKIIMNNIHFFNNYKFIIFWVCDIFESMQELLGWRVFGWFKLHGWIYILFFCQVRWRCIVCGLRTTILCALQSYECVSIKYVHSIFPFS